MAISGELSTGKLYIGPEIPVKLDQSTLTLNQNNPFSGTLSCVGPAFFGAPTNIGFSRAVVSIGPAIPPFSPAIPTLGLEVTAGTQHIGYMNNFALSNFFGTSNNTGMWNAIGLKNMMGLFNRVGSGVEVGGKTAAEPNNQTAALDQNLSSPDGDLYGYWKYNGTPLSFLHTHSDARLKTNIKPIRSALSKILDLQGVTFEWTHWEQKRKYPGTNIGFVAQEVEKIVPEVIINTTVDGNDGNRINVIGVKYENLVALLVEAMKEQQSQIEDLKKRLDELEKL